MARLFNGSTQYASATPATTGCPFTFAAWCNFTNFIQHQTILEILDTGANHYFALQYSYTSNYAETSCYDGSGFCDVTSSPTTVTTAGWHHFAATFTTSGGKITPTIFLDGVGTSGAAVTCNPTGINNVRIGVHKDLSGWIFGSVVDAAVWGVALSNAEIVSLVKGARPCTMRPASLTAWWPLDGLQSPEPDLSGNANNMTLIASPPLAAGAPVAMFTPRWPQDPSIASVVTPASQPIACPLVFV